MPDKEHPLFRPLSLFHLSLCIPIGFTCLVLYYSEAVLREWDFTVYYLASEAIWTGQNLYEPAVLYHISEEIEGIGYAGLPYLYSPLLARLLYPLIHLSFFNAACVWFLLKCLALEVLFLLILRLLKVPVSLIWLVLLHGVALLYRPIALDIYSGNIAIFESTLALAFFIFWAQERLALSSLSLWSSGMMKGFPFLLILYPLHLRNMRFLRNFAGIGVLFMTWAVLDYNAILQWSAYFQSPEWLQMWDEQVQSFFNCSATTVILRSFSDTYFSEPIIHAPWLVPVLVPLFPVMIFTLLVFALHRNEQQKEPLAPTDTRTISLLICSILLLPPRLAGYSLAWTLLPFICNMVWGLQMRRLNAIVMTLSGFILLQLNIPPEHIPSGIPQLLIDKEFFGLLLLFLSSFLIVRHSIKDQ